MNTLGLIASAVAIAGASFGVGRITASASSSATASAAPASCNSNDALAEILKKGEADRQASQARNLQAAEAAQQIKAPDINASPIH